MSNQRHHTSPEITRLPNILSLNPVVGAALYCPHGYTDSPRGEAVGIAAGKTNLLRLRDLQFDFRG